MRVYLNEYNIRMERSAYLPLSTGLLRAYAETREKIKTNYEFQPFFYHIDSPQRILGQYRNPGVAAFSVSMWNEQLVHTIAKEVKDRWPECLIIMGGPQVPQTPDEYFKEKPWLDVAVRSEGEEAFSEILERFTESRDFTGIQGVSFRTPTGCVKNPGERHQPKDLDPYPSPYIEGLFDSIMAESNLEMQATIETNRGCPFPCSFCYWGQGGLSRKYRFHGIERVKMEIEWAAKNKVRYLFNADSNFGMHKRDEEIAQILVDTKTRYGFPQKFRTCFGKNADERIYEIAKKLHDADMEKGITLALQSNTPVVLKNIQRTNIKMETYEYLQKKFNEVHVPVYSELILGMPGESYQSWKEGIEKLLSAGLQNQLFVYLCQILPNTEMSYPEYQSKHGLIIKRIELNEIHGALRTDDLAIEFEDIIIGNNAMSTQDWRKSLIFSWVMMTMHSLKLGFFIMLWLNKRFGLQFTDFIEYLTQAGSEFPILYSRLKDFDLQINKLLSGKGRGREVPGYGQMYWDEEEAAFLRISENIDAFYEEMRDLTREFLMSKNIEYSYQELIEVIDYQKVRIPAFHVKHRALQIFSHNLPEFFERVLIEDIQVLKEPQTLTLHHRSFADKPTFAKESILWGRKSGTIMNKVDWHPVGR